MSKIVRVFLYIAEEEKVNAPKEAVTCVIQDIMFAEMRKESAKMVDCLIIRRAVYD